MRFDVVRQEQDTSSIPPTLEARHDLDPKKAVAERTFVFHSNNEDPNDLDKMWLINGRPYTKEEVMATVKKGTIEVWNFINTSGQPHPIHVHLVNFQILERNYLTPGDRPLGTYSEMVNLKPGQRVKIIMQFPNYTGRYTLHCHNSVHEDHAMMTNFDVVD